MSLVTASNFETIAQNGKLYGITMESVVKNTPRAWVNFNGTGVVAIRTSWNITSITDNGTGDYTVNITSGFSNTNYGVLLYCGGTSSSYNRKTSEELSAKTTTTSRINTATLSPLSIIDVAIISWMAIG